MARCKLSEATLGGEKKAAEVKGAEQNKTAGLTGSSDRRVEFLIALRLQTMSE